MADEVYVRPEHALPPISTQEKAFLANQIEAAKVKTVLEFGPGTSTEVMAATGAYVTSCEHLDKWFDVAKERFKDNPNVRVLKYHDEIPVTVEGLDDDERFDMGFVDSPQGHKAARKIHEGYEDCSRFNTCLFALQRCKFVILHDANRPCERGTLGRLNVLGYRYHFLTPIIAAITHDGNESRPHQQDASQSGGAPAGAVGECGGVSVDLRSD